MVMDLYDPSICGDLGDSCARRARGSISEPQSSDQQRTECAINSAGFQEDFGQYAKKILREWATTDDVEVSIKGGTKIWLS
jgi:hypothetical protein